MFLSCDGWHTVSVPTISMTDAVSVAHWSFPLPSKVQKTELPCRGEWDSRTTCWVNFTTPTVVSLFRYCDLQKLISNVAGFVRPHRVHRICLDGWSCRGNIGRWAIHICDIDLTEASCKSSWSLDYMQCISDPARCWYFSLSSFWPSQPPT